MATKSRQFSYNIEGLGRCHIRQTGQYITGLQIADDTEFAFNAMAEETDYIVKTALYIMQYVKGECFSIPVPNVMSAPTDKDEAILMAIMNICYGSVLSCKDIGTTPKKIEDLRKSMRMELLVPFHRVRYNGEPGHNQILRDIESNNLPGFQAALAEYLAKQPTDILGAI